MKTRIWLLGLAAVLSFAGILGVTMLLSGEPTLAAPASDGYSVYYVAPGGDCGGMTPCFSSVQAAVDAVDADGETVKVAQGVYTSSLFNVVLITKPLTLLGGYATTNWVTAFPLTQPTTLDGDGLRRVLAITLDRVSTVVTISGFHMTDGRTENFGCYYPNLGGAGVYIGRGTVILSDSYIYDNHATHECYTGGGIHINSQTIVTLTNNTIQNNSANWEGGGVFAHNSHVVLINNRIVSNTVGPSQIGGYAAGGGITLYDEGAYILIGNTIQGNLATGNLSMCGGLWATQVSSIRLDNNLIFSNTVQGSGIGSGFGMGGGVCLFVVAGESRLNNNVVSYNSASAEGGGVWIYTLSPTQMSHNTLVGNQSGDGATIALAYQDDGITAWLTNTIIADSSIGVSVLGDNLLSMNGILWSNVPLTVSQSPTATVNVANAYHGDPAFAADGYHLTAGSAALNRGVPTDVTTDIDGEPRWSGPAPDLGADEFQEPPVLPGVPVPISPPNSTVTTTANITFRWQAGAGGAPEGYNLDLDGATITTTTTSYAASLNVGTHLWRVRAFNAAGYSGWGGNWTVEVVCHQVYLPLMARGH